MSVYTRISPSQLKVFLENYALGELINFSGIQAGIENTNYRVNTGKGQFILTVYESLTATEVPPFLALLKQLASHHFSVPNPQKNKLGQSLNTLEGKPAALFNCLPGHSINQPTPGQCEETGRFLAQLHLQPDNRINHTNPNNLKGCQLLFESIKSSLNKKDSDLIYAELQNQSSLPIADLPGGVIHADLFKDNVLFNQGHISGVLDFYNACHEVFIFDIAVTANDWCMEDESINPQKFRALLSGYQTLRVLTEAETTYLPQYLRLTALRFWLSRLAHQQQTKKAELTLIKDPLVFRRILEFHRSRTNSNDTGIPINGC